MASLPKFASWVEHLMKPDAGEIDGRRQGRLSHTPAHPTSSPPTLQHTNLTVMIYIRGGDWGEDTRVEPDEVREIKELMEVVGWGGEEGQVANPKRALVFGKGKVRRMKAEFERGE